MAVSPLSSWNSRLALTLLVSGAVVFQACSVRPTQEKRKAPPEAEAPVQVQAEAATDPFPAEAEVSTDLAELAGGPVTPKVQGAPAPAPAPVKPSQEVLAESPEAPDAPDRLPAGELTTYKVKQGDTLMKIAFGLYGDLYRWKLLFRLNRDLLRGNHEQLSAGMRLKVYKQAPFVLERNGEPYLIRRHDTLSKISTGLYGTANRWRDLWGNNRQLIRDPNLIFAGFYLYYTASPQRRLAEIQPKREPSSVGPTQPAQAQAQQLGPPAPALAPPPPATAPLPVLTGPAQPPAGG